MSQRPFSSHSASYRKAWRKGKEVRMLRGKVWRLGDISLLKLWLSGINWAPGQWGSGGYTWAQAQIPRGCKKRAHRSLRGCPHLPLPHHPESQRTSSSLIWPQVAAVTRFWIKGQGWVLSLAARLMESLEHRWSLGRGGWDQRRGTRLEPWQEWKMILSQSF